MAAKGLSSRTVVLLVMMIIVIAMAVYMVLTVFLPGKAGLFGGNCKSIMLSQCSACIAGTGGGDCAGEGILSCGCNYCDIQYPGLEASRVSDCVKELQVTGIDIDATGGFKTAECGKLGARYAVHPAGRCS